MKTRKLKAITLFEVLLAVALLASTVVILIPISRDFLLQDELNVAHNLTVKSLRSAQAQAIAGKDDSVWGVKMQNSQLVQFKGDSFATRDSLFDAVTQVSSRVSFSGRTEFVFNKTTGAPVVPGSVSLTEGNNSFTITVNAKGNVD